MILMGSAMQTMSVVNPGLMGEQDVEKPMPGGYWSSMRTRPFGALSTPLCLKRASISPKPSEWTRRSRWRRLFIVTSPCWPRTWMDDNRSTSAGSYGRTAPVSGFSCLPPERTRVTSWKRSTLERTIASQSHYG